jgi:hypothetical protein
MARPIKHTRYVADVSFGGKLAPTLSALKKRLKNREGLNAELATDAASKTRKWIREAAESRHTTAQALGASPTGYLLKRARDVEARHDAKVADVIIKGAIFARVFRDVEITPKKAKYLTIPVHKEALGKRARDFDNLIVKSSKKTGAKFLCRKGRGKALIALFMLVKRSLLPQDAGLLPSQKHFTRWAEAKAKEYLREFLKSPQNFTSGGRLA